MNNKNGEWYKKTTGYIWKFIRYIWKCMNGRKWYSLLLLLSSLYVWKYRFEINQLKELNAKNIIFILWIFLLAFPLFSEMEILGIKVKTEVEKATEEVKESLKNIQTQIIQLQMNNSVSNKISIENTPLPSEKTLEDMQKNISGSEKEVSELEIQNNRDKNIFLFETRQEIEMALREICEKIGHPEILASMEMLRLISEKELIDNGTEKLIMEVQKITSRGIHGEIVSDEYITFVKTVRQKLLQQLKEISKKIEYIKCLNCGYSGYSKDGKICPKCGKDCSVDFW